MGVNRLEQELRERLLEGDAESAYQRILEQVDKTIAQAEKIAPKKAREEERRKDGHDYPGICMSYHCEAEAARKKGFIKKRYGLEAELLGAENKRRVARLFAKAKPVIEERYGRMFESREDFAISLGVAQSCNSLEDTLENTRRMRERHHAFSELAGEDEESAMSALREGIAT